MEDSLQVHVFASLYTFSESAVLSEKSAVINACPEWRDEKYLCMSSNDEACVTAAFDLYTAYIGHEKLTVPDPYEIFKLKRPIETLTKTARAEALPDPKKIYNVEDSSKNLLNHETKSRVWYLPVHLKTIPKRLITLKILGQIGDRASCRVVSSEAGMVTVRGDNDHDLTETLERLDDFARVLVSLRKSSETIQCSNQSKSTRQFQPQIFNSVIPEEGTDVRFRLTPLEAHEASDQRSTTLIDQRSLQGNQPILAIILKATKSGSILTCSRSAYDSTTPKEITWCYASIPLFGDQNTTVSRDGSDQAYQSTSNFAPRSIAEWVAAVPYTGVDPTNPFPSTQKTIENSPTVRVDSSQPKKRFGRNRKKPDLDDITEFISPEEGILTSDLIQQPDGTTTDPSAMFNGASTLSTSKSPSDSGSQKSPPVANASSSTTPSIQNSKHHNLLMSADLDLAYPVMTPIQALNAHDLRSQASHSNNIGYPASPPPEWVRRNATSLAENQRNALLIDCTDSKRNKQVSSYAAAAKRGTITGGSSRGQGNMCGGPSTYGPTPSQQARAPTGPSNHAQYSNESVKWPIPKTTSKVRKARSDAAITTIQAIQKSAPARPTASPYDPSRHEDLTTIQLLQQAKKVSRVVKMEVEIGRILIKTDSIQPSRSGRWTNIYSAWSSIFSIEAGPKPETIFTDRLPNPHSDVGFPSNIREAGGQQIFTDLPYDCNVTYQFLCTTVAGDEDVILNISSGNVQICGLDQVIGAFQWHFPGRQWDARLTIKTSEIIQDYEDAIQAVISSLSVVPSPDGATATLFADLGNSGLIFRSANLLRKVHFRCLSDPDISLSCTETQYLGQAKEQRRYFNTQMDRAAAEAQGDIWWGITLASTTASSKVHQGNWTAEEMVEAGVAQRLQAVAIEIVTQIDGIGAQIQQATTQTLSRTARTESYRGNFWTEGMGPPPAKRRKRVVVLSSEDEEVEPAEPGRSNEYSARRTSLEDQATQDHKIQVLPTRLRSTTKPVTKAPPIASVQSTNQPLPKKSAARHDGSRKDPRPSSLDTYFSAAGNVHAVKSASSQNPKVVSAIEEEDFIEDDSFDEELQKLPLSHRALNQAPTQAQSQPTILKQKTSSTTLLSGSQVFRKLGNGIERSKKKDDAVKLSEDDTRPWAERYEPLSLEELAVHKKKVADVRDWLYNVFQGRSKKKKVLILKGASGVGKTATVSTLSRAMDFDLIEWANPSVSDYASDNYVSTTAQFEEFLRRSGKFSSLEITNNEEPTPSIEKIVPENRKKVILVEEFPNTFMTSTSALQSFRSSILQYLATSTPKDAIMPLVMILTESQMTGTSFLTDTVTAHRLLGPSILNHPFTDTIEFNPIAPSFITKALNLILQKEARNSGRRRIPGPPVLKRLSVSGDVRSAIGSLEFLCLKGQDGDNWSGRVAAKGKKGAKTANAITDMEERSLELVTRRE
ncbi:MAG: hypothetical protein Q9192_004131, partial [Flavoplaca navasiana]